MGNAAETKNTQVKKGDVVIEARNIVKRYGHLEALRGANIKVVQSRGRLVNLFAKGSLWTFSPFQVHRRWAYKLCIRILR